VEKPAAKPVEKPAPVPAAKAKGAEEKKDEGPPPSETVLLDTKDNWKIHCVYYPPQEGKRPGKAVAPIIMLHGWQGKGSEFDFLAKGLQTLGYASAVPDLRGHGRSTSWRSPLDGDYKTIKADEKYGFAVAKAEDRGPHADVSSVVYDVEAVKKFLVQRNNTEEVNIEMLCVVGAEFGAAVALNWAVMDWSWPPTTAGKQGQDVKALVLLSPKQQYPRGFRCTQALANPTIAHRLSILIAVGEGEREAFSDAKRIHTPLERVRPKAADPAKQDIVLIRAATPIQGTKLLDRNLPVNRAIVTFLDLRLTRRAEDLPWGERKSPLGSQ
jgi:pimeloyl-ACP methyl ester carboxylesterase